MADTTRRDFITTSAAVAAAAAAGRALGQATANAATPAGTFFQKGDVRIRYLDTGGSGFPLLVIPGGGLNSTIEGLIRSHPFNPIEELGNEFRVITADLRTAWAGESTGPLESDRPWDAFTDDHVGVMDQLGVDRFLTRMKATIAAFGFTVPGDCVIQCEAPVHVIPYDNPTHPYALAMETMMLAPESEASIYPWKEPPERIPIAVRQIR